MHSTTDSLEPHYMIKPVCSFSVAADKNIQSGQHDSAEDACTALLLYERYRQLKAEGTIHSTINELYETGRRLGWKVPDVKLSESPGWTGQDRLDMNDPNMWTGPQDSEDDILDQSVGYFES